MTEPIVVGRYIMCDVIGGGGMAQVHLGRMLGAAGFSRVVAIKRLHRTGDRAFATMLVDEARLASRIRHPNVVPVLDVVRAGLELLLVMEYVHGMSLAWMLEALAGRNERLPLPIAVRIVLDVLAGLQAAHDAKGERGEPLELVHRDVSPHNIVVGVDGVARIIDFGIAKAVRKLSTTQAGQIKGKLSYMAPEQLRAQPVDRRTDVYATGLVLWEAIVGRRLLNTTANNLPMAVKQILATKMERPGVHAEVPPALDELVMTALREAPAERFRSADVMATALEATHEAAKPKIVGACLETLAKEELARRSELVARVELISATYETSSHVSHPSASYAEGNPPSISASEELPVSPLSPRPEAVPEEDDLVPVGVPTRSSAIFVLLALIAGAILLVTVVVVFGSRAGSVREKSTAVRPRPVPPAPTLVVPEEVPSTIPVATVASASAQAVVTPMPPAPRAALTAAASQAKRPRTPDCNPPYSIDSNGIRIPRRECLQE